MEEGEALSIRSRKELRKQKLMEYLKAKGKLKEVNSKPTLQTVSQIKNPATSSLQVMGKENNIPEKFVNRQMVSVPTRSTMALGVCNKETKRVSQQEKQSEATVSDIDRAKKSNRNFGSRSMSTLTCPLGTVSSRISLGPLVKTKTGLVPAVTQAGLNQRHTSVAEKDATRSLNKFKLRHSTSATASRGSNVLTNKKIPPVLKSGEGEKTTLSSKTGAITKAHSQLKASSHLQLDKSTHSSQSQQSNQQKSISNLYRWTNTTNKHEGRMSKCNRATTQPTNGCKNAKSEFKVGKNGQQHIVPSRTSTTGIAHRTKDDQGQKNRMSIKEGDKAGCTSAHVRPPQRTVVAKPSRAVGFTKQTTSAKVPGPLIPPIDGKKQTAAQAERMKKLQEWREAKGISYKRPPMPVKPQAKRSTAPPKPFWATMKNEDEAHSLICAVDRSLADCVKLLGEGCPPEQVRAVLARLPTVSHKFTKYWICQARLREQEGNLDVLPLFEEAVSIVLEPVDELRTVVFEILKKKDEAQAAEDDKEERPDPPAAEKTAELNHNSAATPKPLRALICGEKGDSSVVKYKITATPGRPPNQQKEPARVNGQEVRFFTPVRRSVRIERASLRYPASLQDHDLCVASYSDLISKEDRERIDEDLAGEVSPSVNESPMYVYRENDALKDKVFMRLVCEEEP